uniref:Peptidase M12B domain-containing protein n=1 Tax=Amblyomma maculatum TaxID=34609 RepID=G3MQM3_AMBMU
MWEKLLGKIYFPKKVSKFSYFLYASLLLLTCGATGLQKYQAVVYPQLLEERKHDGSKVLKLGEDITLNLKPSAFLPEDFFVRTYRKGVAQYRYFDVEALQQDLYHDEKALAAVILTEEDGALKVEGVVGPNLRIKHLEGEERAQDGHHAHLIETIENPGNVYGKTFDNELVKVASRSGFDPAAYNVTEIFPEVLVVCDSTFRGGFKTEKLMISYLLIVFGVVNVRYNTVTHPKVNITFRGIEVTEASAETYFVSVAAGEIDGYESLKKIKDHLEEKNDTYAPFDMVFFVTGQDMVVVQGQRKETALAGYAFVGSVCTSHRMQLGEDTPKSYRLIRIMAHELAHTLGCPHDGSSIDGIVKSFKPDATRCPWEDNYIMSYIEEDSRSMKFSSCCIYMIAQMTWSYEAVCLRQVNAQSRLKRKKSRVLLPGELLSKDRQCQLTFPELKTTYFMPEYGTGNCKAECFVSGKQFNAANDHWTMFLIDGSVCNDQGWRCINGDCIKVKGKFKTPKERIRPRRTTTLDYYSQ